MTVQLNINSIYTSSKGSIPGVENVFVFSGSRDVSAERRNYVPGRRSLVSFNCKRPQQQSANFVETTLVVCILTVISPRQCMVILWSPSWMQGPYYLIPGSRTQFQMLC